MCDITVLQLWFLKVVRYAFRNYFVIVILLFIYFFPEFFFKDKDKERISEIFHLKKAGVIPMKCCIFICIKISCLVSHLLVKICIEVIFAG